MPSTLYSSPLLAVNSKSNCVLFICPFFMVSCSSKDMWKISWILYFLGSLSIQTCLAIGCNTWKRPKNLASSLQFCLVLKCLLFNQTLLPDSFETWLPYCELAFEVLGRGGDSAGKCLWDFGAQKIVFPWFSTLSGDLGIFYKKFKDDIYN